MYGFNYYAVSKEVLETNGSIDIKEYAPLATVFYNMQLRCNWCDKVIPKIDKYKTVTFHFDPYKHIFDPETIIVKYVGIASKYGLIRKDINESSGIGLFYATSFPSLICPECGSILNLEKSEKFTDYKQLTIHVPIIEFNTILQTQFIVTDKYSCRFDFRLDDKSELLQLVNDSNVIKVYREDPEVTAIWNTYTIDYFKSDWLKNI